VSRDCYTSSYTFVLHALGHDPRTLGSERTFRYDSDPNEPWPLEGLRWHRRSYAELMQGWHGVEEREIGHPDPEAAWLHIRAAHQAGRPVIVFVSTSELAHLARQPAHQPHRVVLDNSRATSAHLVDRTIGFELSDWIEVAALQTAMASPDLTGLLYPARNVTIELLQGESPQLTPRECALESLHLLARPETERLRSLAADMNRDTPLDSNGQLGMRHYVEGSAVFRELSSQRQLNARFLQLAAELTGLEEFDEAIERANELSVGWHALQRRFRLLALRRPRELLRGIALHIEQIAALEDKLSAAIAARVGSTGTA
jgi:hypothetical protein